MSVKKIQFSHEFALTDNGQRLDAALAAAFPDYSRARLQQWIKSGCVTLDGEVMDRTRYKLAGTERVEVDAELQDEGEWQPEPIDLEIVYEDEHLLIINKPADLVVHPAVGNRAGTLVNALLHYAPELATVPRAGIVHRIDKDTTGLLVVARTLSAHHHLVAKLQAREFTREYDCVVHRQMVAGGTVDAPIGRHGTKRTQMAVVPSGKPAVTHYRVVEKYLDHSHLKVRLETGRTHQIRVHMAYIKHPLVGDPVYGGRFHLPGQRTEALTRCLHRFRRQALHASLLGLEHPVTGESMEWQAPLPEDLETLISSLRRNRQHHDSQ